MFQIQDTDPRTRQMRRRERALEITETLVRAGEPLESARRKAEAAAGGVSELPSLGGSFAPKQRQPKTIRGRRELERQLLREAGGG